MKFSNALSKIFGRKLDTAEQAITQRKSESRSEVESSVDQEKVLNELMENFKGYFERFENVVSLDTLNAHKASGKYKSGFNDLTKQYLWSKEEYENRKKEEGEHREMKMFDEIMVYVIYAWCNGDKDVLTPDLNPDKFERIVYEFWKPTLKSYGVSDKNVRPFISSFFLEIDRLFRMRYPLPSPQLSSGEKN